MKYRKKPVIIDAILWDGHSIKEMVDFITPGVGYNESTGDLAIATLEGVMTGRPGDYIIRGVKGEFYPCKPEIFRATYEEVAEVEKQA